MARHAMVGKETTWGTPVAPTEPFEITTESWRREMTFEDVPSIRQASTAVTNLLTDRIVGDMEVIGHYHDLGLLLKAFMSSVTTTGAGPYTHTFPATTGVTTRPSLTVEINRDSAALGWRYAGVILDSMVVTVSANQSPRFVFGGKGKSEAKGTIATPSYNTAAYMTKNHASMTFDSAAMDITDLTLTANWPTDDPYLLNGSAQYGLQPIDSDLFTVEFSANVLVTDLVEYNKMDGATSYDVAITITNATHSITFNLDKTLIRSFPINISGRERLSGTLTGRTIFNTTATECMQVVLINTDVSIP